LKQQNKFLGIVKHAHAMKKLEATAKAKMRKRKERSTEISKAPPKARVKKGSN